MKEIIDLEKEIKKQAKQHKDRGITDIISIITKKVLELEKQDKFILGIISKVAREIKR